MQLTLPCKQINLGLGKHKMCFSKGTSGTTGPLGTDGCWVVPMANQKEEAKADRKGERGKE